MEKQERVIIWLMDKLWQPFHDVSYASPFKEQASPDKRSGWQMDVSILISRESPMTITCLNLPQNFIRPQSSSELYQINVFVLIHRKMASELFCTKAEIKFRSLRNLYTGHGAENLPLCQYCPEIALHLSELKKKIESCILHITSLLCLLHTVITKVIWTSCQLFHFSWHVSSTG